MPLPTKDDILTMDYSFFGNPFVQVGASTSISLDGLDYAYFGNPFWGVSGGTSAPAVIVSFFNDFISCTF